MLFEDTMLMSYSLNAGLHRHNLDTLSEMFLNHNPIKIESLIGVVKIKKIFLKYQLILQQNMLQKMQILHLDYGKYLDQCCQKKKCQLFIII